MLRVRSAAPDDLSRLIEIAAHSATAAHWNPAEYKTILAPESLQNHVVLVVEEEGIVLGFVVGRQLGPEWEIENIAVTGTARRRGLGTRLLGELIRLVQRRGGRAIFLEVRESNLAARRLYEKWAFVETGRRKAYYQNPDEDAVQLTFSL